MYERILLPLDGSAIAEQALPYAVAQAKRFGAELILLRVVEPFPHVRGLSASDLSRIREQTAEWTRTYLKGLAKHAQEQGVTVQMATAEGRPNVAILEYSEANQVDLIVICTRGRSGFSRWLLGSIADRVVRGASVPVLLVRATKEEEGEA
jgi:nucleotide-binding universal stress UspA family protein